MYQGIKKALSITGILLIAVLVMDRFTSTKHAND